MIDKAKMLEMAEDIKDTIQEKQEQTVFDYKVYSICCQVQALLKEQPEIVRCEDCEHCEYPKSEKEWCKNGHLHGNAETWFCADGERKEQDK